MGVVGGSLMQSAGDGSSKHSGDILAILDELPREG